METETGSAYESRRYWERIARQAERYSAQWLSTGFLGTRTWFNEYGVERMRKAVFEAIPRERFNLVLDVGCGPGQWSTLIADKMGTTVVGVDFVHEMLQLAKLRNRGKSIDVNFCQMTAARLGAREEIFDLVISITVLQHVLEIEEWKKAIYEMLRVTRTGGWIVTADPTPAEWSSDRVVRETRIHTYREYVSEFQKNGARLENVFATQTAIDKLIRLASTILAHYAARADGIDLQQFSENYVEYSPRLMFIPCVMVLAIARFFDALLGPVRRADEQTMFRIFLFRKIGVPQP